MLSWRPPHHHHVERSRVHTHTSETPRRWQRYVFEYTRLIHHRLAGARSLPAGLGGMYAGGSQAHPVDGGVGLPRWLRPGSQPQRLLGYGDVEPLSLELGYVGGSCEAELGGKLGMIGNEPAHEADSLAGGHRL